jgi:hypothetical protein
MNAQGLERELRRNRRRVFEDARAPERHRECEAPFRSREIRRQRADLEQSDRMFAAVRHDGEADHRPRGALLLRPPDEPLKRRR